MNKVYSLTRSLESMPMFFTALTICMFSHLHYNVNLNSMMKKDSKSFDVDGPAFINGVITIFKQFHANNYQTYIRQLCHFFKNIAFTIGSQGGSTKPGSQTLPREAYMTLAFLEELIKFENSSRNIISQNIGTFIFDCYRKNGDL